jgi:hypothetical protein
LNADAHIAYFDYILELYDKDWSNIAALIGDNCSTNRSFAGKAKCHFIGCESHRFNLAVKTYLEEYEDTLQKINDIMSKLKNLIPAAKLRKLRHLKAKTRNATQWSSTFEMILRYDKIRDFLPLLEINELDELLLTVRENHEIDSIYEEMKDFESISKALQQDATTLADTRLLFDEISNAYPALKEKLAANANIVLDKYFESAIIRIQQGKAGSLMPSEEQSVRNLKKLPKQNHESIESGCFADRVLKKQRLDKEVSPSEYLDLRFLIPTSNICEQLFSQAGFCFNSQRGSVLPIHAEAQMFLHFNMDLWNIKNTTIKNNN